MDNNKKFCQFCGAEIPADAVLCTGCGRQVTETKPAVEDVPSTGLNVLSFFFPIVGLILYLVNMNTTPVKAKAIGKWALIGFIVGMALSILSVVFTSCTAAMMYY